MPVEKITAADIANQLRKVQEVAPAQAAALQELLARVFSYAKASGYRDGDNPADWRDSLTHLMPDLGKEATRHHPALAYKDVPAFIDKLQSSSRRTSQSVLLFAILTACRSMEAVGARWEEIDMEAAVWSIPAARMKGKVLHRVPLSGAALALLQAQGPKRSGYVFEGRQKGKPFGTSTMRDAMERMGVIASPHGFRTAFRGYTGAQAIWADSLLERCLAHLVGTEVTRSYDREDYLEQRRPIMENWSRFCMGEAAKAAA
jgi:integrase